MEAARSRAEARLPLGVVLRPDKPFRRKEKEGMGGAELTWQPLAALTSWPAGCQSESSRRIEWRRGGGGWRVFALTVTILWKSHFIPLSCLKCAKLISLACPHAPDKNWLFILFPMSYISKCPSHFQHNLVTEAAGWESSGRTCSLLVINILLQQCWCY